MADDDKRDDGDNPAATGAEPKPVSRRLLFFKTLAGAVTLAAAATATTEKAEAQYRLRRGTDNDPYDPAGGGRLRPVRVRRRITDNDPYDAAGRGRGHRVRRRFVTDNDPYDARGRGRGW